MGHFPPLPLYSSLHSSLPSPPPLLIPSLITSLPSPFPPLSLYSSLLSSLPLYSSLHSSLPSPPPLLIPSLIPPLPPPSPSPSCPQVRPSSTATGSPSTTERHTRYLLATASSSIMRVPEGVSTPRMCEAVRMQLTLPSGASKCMM